MAPHDSQAPADLQNRHREFTTPVERPTGGAVHAENRGRFGEAHRDSGMRNTFSLLSATFESTTDGILVVDLHRYVSSINRQFSHMWHLDEPYFELGDDHALIAAVIVQLHDPERFLTRIDELYWTPRVKSQDTVEFKDGGIFERFSMRQYVDGEVVGRVWSFSDVTTEKNLESDLERMAFYDDLTGLANRTLFRDHLNQALARSKRSEKYVAVLYFDVDNVKTVNDSLGHSVRDEMLKSVGAALAECLRR